MVAEVAEAPLLIIDGREADDLDGNVIVVGTGDTLTAGLVGALGKGESPAVTLALEKADTSAVLWGALASEKPFGPEGPKSGVFSANLSGDKLLQAELTFASGEDAAEANMKTGVEVLLLKSITEIKQSGATLTIESTKSGNLVDLLIAAIPKAINGANRFACLQNLNNISMGCILYASENKGKYPESLKALIDKDLVSPRALRCPRDRSQRACSYLYATPSPMAPDQTLMACDLKGNHKQMRNVLFKNGDIGQMSEAKFQAALKLPHNTAFAAALDKAGG